MCDSTLGDPGFVAAMSSCVVRVQKCKEYSWELSKNVSQVAAKELTFQDGLICLFWWSIWFR